MKRKTEKELDRSIVMTAENIEQDLNEYTLNGTTHEQLINEMDVIAEEIMSKKKEKKVSTSYTLKSYKNNIDKLEHGKMITHEEAEQLKDLYKKMVNRWVSLEMAI